MYFSRYLAAKNYEQITETGSNCTVNGFYYYALL